jgi:acyl carrier protein
MDETRVHVLDEELRPVPDGETGELYVAGARLAAGYVGRPDLTAERFVEDPSTGSGERMYRTGDLCRVGEDGAIVHVGRVDDQVKIRGFRVEPAAVEAALAGHRDVDQVVVVATDVDLDAKRLVAYVVSKSGADPDSVRAHASRVLPDYMVPSAVVALDTLPLTANGKLDRKALPAPGPASGAAGVAPRNEVEAALCEIFADALGHAEVGVDDDFFDLGGESINAMRLLSRVRKTFGVEVTIDVFFDVSTVAGLAVRVRERVRTAA